MERMLLLDIETGGFQVEDGIYEVAVLAVVNGTIVDSLHLGEVEDENDIHEGMGAGYACISENKHYISQFQSFVTKYPYPYVAHNASFDRKFLVHYGWMSGDTPFYDSVRAIKRACPHLFGYSLDYLVNFFCIERGNAHTAIDDVHVLFKILDAARPNQWLPLYKASPKGFKSSAKTFLERGLKLKGDSEAFDGKHLVFTGASQFPRVLMQEIAVACGATVGNSVGKKTDYLICGEKVGINKINKAIELDVPMYEDNWFIDIVFQDLAIEESEYKPIKPSNNSEQLQNLSNQSPYKFLSEFEGKKVNIACLKLRVQSIVGNLLEQMGATVVASPSAKKVDYMIHTDNGEYKLLEQAKELGISAIPISKFNRMVLEGEIAWKVL
ncbi:BRCT domain-containing protein [Clostridium sp.]|uniref:BRCT domain-containing protein n=1 Tax=Clostridium sp. TaxID=1506 RepID=UPI00261BE2B2|nr:BRCT domain-containing protein [Clostridium sp.]